MDRLTFLGEKRYHYAVWDDGLTLCGRRWRTGDAGGVHADARVFRGDPPGYEPCLKCRDIMTELRGEDR